MEKMKQKMCSVWGRMRTGWHNFVNKVRDLVANRPEVVVAILGTIVMAIKSLTRIFVTRKEEKLHDNFVYDRRAGHYCETRRKLKGYEFEELDRRYKNGESYSTILKDMGLLK